MDMENLTSDGELRLALEQSVTATVLIENDRVVLFNNTAEKIWGYTRHDVAGKPVSLLLSPFERASDLGVGVERELQLTRQNGSRVWAALIASRIEHAGRVRYLVAARDVSAQIAGRRQNRMMTMAINHAQRPILLLDARRRIIHVNAAFTQTYGYAPHEVIGHNPIDLLSMPLITPDILTRHRNLPWGRSKIQTETRGLSKDGHESWVRVSSAPFDVPPEDEMHGYSVDVLFDVTEERQIREFEHDVLEALTSSLSFTDFGDYLCQQVKKIAPEALPSILRVDEEKRMRPWSVSRLPEEYNAAIDGMKIGDSVGSCGTAAWYGEYVQCDDIATDPLWSAFRTLALRNNLRACWSYPIKRRDGSVAGTFAFYATQAGGLKAFHERVINACVNLCSLAIEREESRQRVEKLTQFDMLTGLPNSQQLYRRVDGLLEQAPAKDIAFFSLGLSHFSNINEMFGHTAGNQVLITIANRLQQQKKPGEFLCRPEGDVFVMVVPGCDVRNAAQLAIRLENIVNQPIETGGHHISVRLNIGISHYPEGGGDRDMLLSNAKSAMYQAKNAGSVYRFFDPDMNRAIRERLLLGMALKRAIAAGELYLHYQPQVYADSGELYGVEALARWRDAEFGEVPPDKFIILAEELGEIETIGRWTLREVCRQMAEWRAAGIAVPTISLNLSPLNFRSPDLPDFIAALLREYRLPGGSLTVEITESAVMELTPEMLALMHAIRALGVGLSVDDFGTGFSTLSNLVNLPVTEVKIDRSFISGLQESRMQTLVTAIIGIGRSMKLEVVAEGVETPEQLNLLKHQACPVFQGHFFSRPINARDIPQWLRHRTSGGEDNNLNEPDGGAGA